MRTAKCRTTAAPAPARSDENIRIMAYSIFPQTSNNPLTEPMFFGQPVNVAR